MAGPVPSRGRAFAFEPVRIAYKFHRVVDANKVFELSGNAGWLAREAGLRFGSASMLSVMLVVVLPAQPAYI